MGLFDTDRTTTQTQSSSLPAWMQQASQQTFQQAQALASQPYTPYQGPRVAGFNPDQLASFDLTKANVGSYQPYLDASAGLATGAANPFSQTFTPTPIDYQPVSGPQIGGLPLTDPMMVGAPGTIEPTFVGAPGTITPMMIDQPGAIDPMLVAAGSVDPQMVSAGALPDVDLAQYMNPFQAQVIDEAIKEMQRHFDIQRVQNRAPATNADAYGGARHGVMDAETYSRQNQLQNQIIASLMSENYLNAQQQAQTDMNRALSAALANQATDLQAGTTNLQADLQAQLANQAVDVNAQATNIANTLQAQLANQGVDISAQSQNVMNALQAALADQSLDYQAKAQNVANALQAALADQGVDLQAQGINLQATLSALLANQDVGLTSQLANQQAGLTADQFNQNLLAQAFGLNASQYNADMLRMLESAGLLQDLGMTQQQAGLTDAAAMGAIGAQQQGLAQANMDTAYQDFLRQLGWPYEMLNYQTSILGGVPYQASQTTTTQAPGPNPFAQGIGATAALLSLFL